MVAGEFHQGSPFFPPVSLSGKVASLLCTGGGGNGERIFSRAALWQERLLPCSPEASEEPSSHVFHHFLLKVPSLVVLRCSQMTCSLFPLLQTQLFLWMLPTVPSLLGQEWDLSTPPGHLVCDENPPSSLGHCYPWAFCLGRRQTGPLTPTMLGLAPAKSYVAPYNTAPVFFQKTIQSAQAANISQARPLG